jgi:Fe-S-cluster-containing dehydrogenase component
MTLPPGCVSTVGLKENNKMKVFVHDSAICNGCHNCQIACKDEHVANDWTPYAKPQPETGQFWLKLTETVRGQVPRVKVAYYPILCNHCEDALCMAACKVKGAIFKRDDGLVIIDPVKCTGCKSCVDACPYKAIYFNDDLNLAQKCTGCAHLLDNGWTEPRCVDACPTLALKFMEESEAKEYINDAEYIKPERAKQDKPMVYYLNLPKRFIAGTVYDPVEKEVVIGATATLADTASKKTYTAKTDDFGDFEFEKLPVSKYILTIEKGKKSTKIDVTTVEKDISLGDIPLAMH